MRKRKVFLPKKWKRESFVVYFFLVLCYLNTQFIVKRCWINKRRFEGNSIFDSKLINANHSYLNCMSRRGVSISWKFFHSMKVLLWILNSSVMKNIWTSHRTMSEWIKFDMLPAYAFPSCTDNIYEKTFTTPSLFLFQWLMMALWSNYEQKCKSRCKNFLFLQEKNAFLTLSWSIIYNAWQKFVEVKNYPEKMMHLPLQLFVNYKLPSCCAALNTSGTELENVVKFCETEGRSLNFPALCQTKPIKICKTASNSRRDFVGWNGLKKSGWMKARAG